MELAELLNEASRNLTPQDFRTLRSQVGLKDSTLSALRAILKDSRLANPEYIAYLPDNIYTLYQITFLDDEHFAAAIRNGIISPECTAKQIRSYRDSLKGGRSALAVTSLFEDEPTSIDLNTPETAAAVCAADAANADNAAQRQPSPERQEPIADTADVSGVRLDSDEPKIVGKFSIPTSMIGSRPALAVERLADQLNHMSNLNILVSYV